MNTRNDGGRTRLDPVLWLILSNAAAGAVVALIVVGAIFYLDIGRLGTLISGSEAPFLATFLLAAGFVVTFSSAAMGSAVMRLGRDGGEGGPDTGSLRPIPAKIRRRR